jgi:DNA processing protein
MQMLWLNLLTLRQAAKNCKVLADLWLASGPPLVLGPPCSIARRQLFAIETLGIHIVPIWDLPPRLQKTRAPLLFVRGNLELLQRTAISIIGSRKACRSAEDWAFEKARLAAEQKSLVVSGGALGIDTAAHRGALAAHGPTLVYLGVPIDQVYPSRNLSLFEQIVATGGALVSEHPPLARTFISDHAMRNRFIAAHAEKLLIAEANEGSGSLVTADWAKRYSVPVFVSPTGVGQQRRGVEQLLQKNRANTC